MTYTSTFLFITLLGVCVCFPQRDLSQFTPGRPVNVANPLVHPASGGSVGTRPHTRPAFIPFHNQQQLSDHQNIPPASELTKPASNQHEKTESEPINHKETESEPINHKVSESQPLNHKETESEPAANHKETESESSGETSELLTQKALLDHEETESESGETTNHSSEQNSKPANHDDDEEEETEAENGEIPHASDLTKPVPRPYQRPQTLPAPAPARPQTLPAPAPARPQTLPAPAPAVSPAKLTTTTGSRSAERDEFAPLPEGPIVEPRPFSPSDLTKPAARPPRPHVQPTPPQGYKPSPQ
ncbi:hypothetical protein Pcinc_028588 [Petrolisthes cinctipes]|uniref:Uncharacterized protein n=1 Tax=Petrolisthes cinctipes TaxID=88211 RepID=A0AAE1F2K6_PETCI|nr:hypothetical protein Pcinc_028588 [Petrolisthes cinctipes]